MYTVNEDSLKYHTGLKALSKYNKLAYKEILFTVLPKLREGDFTKDNDTTLKHYLPCDDKFKRLYGDLYLVYHVDYIKHEVVLDNIEPEDILKKCYTKYLDIIDGVPIADDKALFKITALRYMEGRR